MNNKIIITTGDPNGIGAEITIKALNKLKLPPNRVAIISNKHILEVNNWKSDYELIAIPYNDPNYNMYDDIDQLPRHIFDEMRHFFSVYKNLENKETAVDEVQNREAAIKITQNAINNYIEKFCK